MSAKTVLAVALSFAMFWSVAAADPLPRWTDPSGSISVDEESLGWDRATIGDDGELLTLVHPMFDQGRRGVCAVHSWTRGPVPSGATQERVNQITRGEYEESVERRSPGDGVVSVELNDIQGITSFDSVLQNEPSRQRWRKFRVLGNGSFTLYRIGCFFDNPVSTQEIEQMETFVTSVQIARSGAQ